MLEKDIAEYVINKLLDNNFVCVDKSGNPKFYYFNGNVWVEDKANVKIDYIIDNILTKQYETLFLETSDEQEKLQKSHRWTL